MEKDVENALCDLIKLVDRAYWQRGRPNHCKAFDVTYCKDCEDLKYCESRQHVIAHVTGSENMEI